MEDLVLITYLFPDDDDDDDEDGLKRGSVARGRT